MTQDERDRELGRRLLEEAIGGDVPRAPDGPAMEVEIARGTPCAHRDARVCADQRSVTCMACGAPLDAFAIVWELATRVRVRRARELAEQLEARVRAGAQGALDL